MGVYEDMVARIQGLPPGAAFPDVGAIPAAEESWLPQMLLPPHKRNKTEEPDAQAIAIQHALGNDPAGPAIPKSMMVHAAGMLPLDDPSPFNSPQGQQMVADAGGAPAPTVPMPAPRPADAPGPESVPLPMARPAAADAPPVAAAPPVSIKPPIMASDADEAAAPPAAAPAAAVSSPFQMPSILDKLRTTLGNNSNTLLALGAGFAGAPNIGQGISRASAAAIPARAADIKQTLQSQNQNLVRDALIKAGVPRDQAQAGALDPELKKAYIQSYIADPKTEIKMIKSKDAWGNESEVPYIFNSKEQTFKPVNMATGGAGVNASAPGSSQPTATFAPGVTAQTFDHTKVGDDYLGQFSPEVQASVKSYLKGESLPAGNKVPAQMLKMAAQKYGNDIGMSADDASIVQRKEWSKSIGNTSSGVGLQSKGFQQGLEHFVKLSDNLVKMNLSNGMGIEPVAGVINSAKNLTTNQQELVHKSDVIGQALAREMGNLFSKNGGGVHEAAETKKNVSNSTMSSKAAAGSLEAIDELMQGGLRTLEQRRDELFPTGNAPKGSQFLGPKQQEALEHIRNNIAILKGEKVAAPEPAAAPPVASAPKPGNYVYQGGKLVPVQ